MLPAARPCRTVRRERRDIDGKSGESGWELGLRGMGIGH
jgi:hypothetical protein